MFRPRRLRLALAFGILYLGGCSGGSTPARPTDFDGTGLVGSSLTRGQPSPSTTADVIPFRRILCFGDSVTFGVTQKASLAVGGRDALAPVEGYVAKLWRLIEDQYGTGYELINAGVAGESVTAGVERMRDEIRVHSPDLVLLLEGVVDVNNPQPRFTDVEDNLDEMIRTVQKSGAEVILGTYPLLNPDGFRTRGIDNVPALNDLIRQTAARRGVVVADHERAQPDLSGQGPDGLHPNNLGYEAMAVTWLTAIEVLAAASGT
jgi:lysophospholipase L1-like esterase